MRLLLREHGSAVDAELPALTASSLAQSQLVRLTPLGATRWRLEPGDRVGAVRIGDTEIVVEPKIGPRNVLFLLGYAADPGFRPEDVDGIDDEDLLPVVAEFVARHVERAIRPGVLQGYVTHDDALMLVRGRIRAADHMARRAGLLLPVEVRYDEYSADIAENRLLRAAVRRMLAVPRIIPDVRRRLGHLDGRLDGVTPLIPGQPLPSWTPSRLNERYRPALRIADIVLRNLSVDIGPGDVAVASFVADMAKVFEDFVTVALREAAADVPGAMAAQYPVALSVGGRVPMYPDIVHVVDGTPRAVFDAKYKIERARRDIPNADVYQMLAYCTALRLDRGRLIYAKGQGDPVTHRIVHTDPPVDVIQHPLDLEAPPADMLKQIDALVASAMRARTESPETLAKAGAAINSRV